MIYFLLNGVVDVNKSSATNAARSVKQVGESPYAEDFAAVMPGDYQCNVIFLSIDYRGFADFARDEHIAWLLPDSKFLDFGTTCATANGDRVSGIRVDRADHNNALGEYRLEKRLGNLALTDNAYVGIAEPRRDLHLQQAGNDRIIPDSIVEIKRQVVTVQADSGLYELSHIIAVAVNKPMVLDGIPETIRVMHHDSIRLGLDSLFNLGIPMADTGNNRLNLVVGVASRIDQQTVRAKILTRKLLNIEQVIQVLCK